MQSRVFLLIIALLGFAFMVTATPVPNEDAIAKKALKQYQMKRRDGSIPVKRQNSQPSKTWETVVATGAVN